MNNKLITSHTLTTNLNSDNIIINDSNTEPNMSFLVYSNADTNLCKSDKRIMMIKHRQA
jgi:hypothetical protein